MILVIGILVDDAIVIGENIYAHYQKGKREINIGPARLKFKIWLKDLNIHWKKLEKDIDSEQLEKDVKDLGKGIKKEFKRIKFK